MDKTLVVIDPVSREMVYNAVKSVKSMKARIVDFFRDSKEKAAAAHKAICKNEQSFTVKLEAFEKAGKQAILDYDDKIEKERKAEEDRLQAIENERVRREREKAEQEAARQRKIEEDARAKAGQARREAEAASAAERARLLKEAEASDRKAAAASGKAEAKTEAAANIIPPVVQVASTATKSAGESKVRIWKGRIIDINAIPREYLLSFINIIGGDRFLMAVNAFARSTKGAVPVDGIQFYEEKSLAVK